MGIFTIILVLQCNLNGKFHDFVKPFRLKSFTESPFILIVLFQIHCGCVEKQNDKNCVTVQIFLKLTVYRVVSAPYQRWHR